MKVSICIPVYGVEKYIERCACSALEQSYNDIEFIIVNDCTKDRSIEILNNVLNKYPDRKNNVKIINHTENKGLASARNTAVEEVSGDFLFWLDGDDYIDKYAIEKAVKSQKETNSDIVIVDFLKLHNNYNEYISQYNTTNPREYIHKMLRDECGHWLWGKLIRSSLYKENKIKALDGANMGEDFQVCPQLMLYANLLSYVKEALYFYDMRNESSYGHSIKENIQWQRWRSYDELSSKLSDKEFIVDLNYQKLQMIYFQLKSFYLSPDTLSIDYYNFLIDKLKEVDIDIIDNYTIYKRIFVMKCYKLGKVYNKTELPLKKLKLYVITINHIKRLLTQIKSLIN